MRGIWLFFFLLTASTSAISPHRLSLSNVVDQAEWVASARVLSLEALHGNQGSGLSFRVEILQTIDGQAPLSPATLVYWEAWPSRDPDGRTEAPIWSGSGLERRLSQGDEVILISTGSGLSRAEPLEAEGEIRTLLQARAR